MDQTFSEGLNNKINFRKLLSTVSGGSAFTWVRPWYVTYSTRKSLSGLKNSIYHDNSNKPVCGRKTSGNFKKNIKRTLLAAGTALAGVTIGLMGEASAGTLNLSGTTIDQPTLKPRRSGREGLTLRIVA